MTGLGLGDAVERALSAVGVTPDRVTGWLGGPCGCAERKEALNALSFWAARVLRGRTTNARAYLYNLLGLTEDEGAGGADDGPQDP